VTVNASCRLNILRRHIALRDHVSDLQSALRVGKINSGVLILASIRLISNRESASIIDEPESGQGVYFYKQIVSPAWHVAPRQFIVEWEIRNGLVPKIDCQHFLKKQP